MKRFSKIIMLMTVLLCLFILPTEAEAATYYSNGFDFSLSNGKATITGCHTSVSGALVIPATINSYPVTAIGNDAFYNCTALTSVTIPDGVTSIGNRAFKNCYYLTDITIPASVTRVGLDSFVGCSRLTSVHITDLAAWCDIWFGSELITLYSNPLCYADNLYLNGTPITDLVIPDSVTEICTYAFAGYSGLTRVTIPEGVTNVGEGAFYGCNNLISVTILDSVTTIGDEAFYSCDNLSDVTIGNGVTSIGSKVFHDTGYYKNASNWENDALYVGNYFIVAKPSITGACTIKANTRTIAEQAFISCTGLTSVTIPDSVIRIPSGVFHGCSSLESITIPFVGGSKKAASATYQYPFGYIFGTGSYTGGIATTQYYYGSSTSSNTYSTYYIPATLKSVTVTGGRLNYGAFYSCDNLSGVTIGNGVTSIGDCAFVGCSELTSITIPDSVTSIGKSAFYYCEGLTSVIIGNGVTSIGNNAFEGCNSLTSITIPNCVTKIREQAFKDCTSLTSITIPAGITEIGESSFEGCTNLTSINIPDSVTSIGAWAFSGCTNLTGSFVIPDGVARLEMGTFMDCSSLRSVTIGSGVTRIDNYVFNNCSSLTNITIPANVQTIDEDVFSGCSSLTGIWAAEDSEYLSSDSYGVVFNKDITRLIAAPGMLSNCYTIPDGVNIIVRGAFFGCTNLTSIIVPGSVTGIYGYAFGSCPNLTSVTYCGTEVQWEQISILEDNDALSDAHRSYHNVVDGICNLCQHFGTCGDNLTWTLDDEGTLTISGTGVMKDYRGSSSTPWYSLQPSISRIVIENGVTTIGGSAFSGCASVTSVTIGDNVTSIGADAFLGCSELISITIPHAITNIQKYAFMGCTALADVWYDGTKYEKAQISINSLFNGALINAVWHYPTCEIHEYSTACDTICDACDCVRVTSTNHIYDSIGDTICNECKQLRYLSYKIENGRASITDCVYTASSIIVPTQIDGYPVTSIANHAFCRKDQLTDIFLPDSITAIGTFAFEECTSLTRIIIPDNVTLIADCTFDGCENLVNVSIGKNVTKIGTYAFRGCDSLETIVFSNSVVSISERVFDGCASLTDVWYQGSADNYALIAIDNNGNESLTDATWHYNTCSAHSYTTNCDASCNACEWTRIPSDHVYTDITDTICNECGVARYWVEFRNYDDTKLSAAYYYLNDNVIPPANPTKAADNTYTYTFAGWDNEVVNCAGNATYTATYTPTYINYTVIFVDEDGTELSKKTYHWDDEIVVPADPTKAADNAYTYPFAGWDNDVVNCAGNATYTATFTPIYIDYTVVFKDWNGTVLSTKTYHYGDMVTAPSNPTRAADDTYIYTFKGWDKTVVNCTGDATYTATYTHQRKDGLLYSINDGYVTIIGYVGNGGALIIPDSIEGLPVTDIGRRAFYDSIGLISIAIPDSVTSIGDSAFENCSSLTSIIIPDSVTRISSGAFYKCTSLTSITIPSNVTRINSAVFEGCKGLISITIPDGVTSIGGDAFFGCYGLTSVTYCGTQEQWNAISISGGNAKLTDADLQFHNIVDGKCTFCGYKALYTVVFQDWNGTVLSTETYHWGNAVVAPTNPTKAADNTYTYTFAGWDQTVVNCAGDAIYTATYTPSYINYTVTFKNWDGTVLSSKTYHWGDAVEKPGNPTRAADGAYIYTFAGWDDEVVDCAGNATYTATYTRQRKDGFLYSIQGNKVTITGYVGDEGEVSIPSVIDGFPVTSIGSFAFSGCTEVTSIIIPNSVTYISMRAFDNCSGLTSITIPDSAAFPDGGGPDYVAFTGCPNFTKLIVADGSQALTLAMVRGKERLTEVIIPNSVTSIDGSALRGCTKLESIIIPNSVTNIGNYAFGNCTSLTSIIIPDSVNSIGWYAFADCTSLTSATISNSVTSIGSHAFFGCTGLTHITIPDSVTDIAYGTFEDCTNLTSITIPNSVISIGWNAFENCTSLTTVIYCGTQAEWNDISVGTPNEPLTKATLQFHNYINDECEYCGDIRQYAVVFRNWDGTVLSSRAYHWGDKVTVPSSPTKTADNTYTYTFAGWDNDVVNCMGNATYTATYASTYIDYTVVFKDWSGTVLSSKTYHWGDKVTVPSSPTKTADNTYTYTFAGWDNDVVNCAGNATYTATYTATYIDYTVTFKNWNGTVLSSKAYYWGDKVTVPSSPTKTADNTYTYTFAGWDSTVTTCNGNKTYIAVFTPKYIDYTVTFKNWDGSVLDSNQYYYNDTVTPPANPTRPEDGTYRYTFKGWDSEIVNAIANKIYTAVYEAIKKIVEITSQIFNVQRDSIGKIGTGTSADSFVSKLDQGENVEIYKGSTQVSGSTSVGTGMEAKLMDGNEAVKTYTIVVTGDTNGDGTISVTDMISIKAHLLGKSKLTGAYAEAGDTSGDDAISITDFIQLKAQILGKGNIIPN